MQLTTVFVSRPTLKIVSVNIFHRLCFMCSTLHILGLTSFEICHFTHTQISFSFFVTGDPSMLSMTGDFDESGRTAWYDENNVELLLNDKAVSIDTASKTITGASGNLVPYDTAVLATGSYPFVPPIPGRNRPGVFVYRTIEDLEAMLAYVKEHNVKSGAVIGGGLLGLEAAKAVKDMGVESHIVEFADILMCRQIDEGGHNALVGTIEDLGLKVHCGARTNVFVGNDGTSGDESDAPVAALNFSNEDWDDLPVRHFFHRNEKLLKLFSH